MAELKSNNVDQESMLGKAFEDFGGKVTSELYRLQNMVRLVAFACEARRTLDAYQGHARRFPDFKKHFEMSVDASSNWDCFRDVSAEVLRDIDDRMGALSEEIYEGSAAIEKLALN